MSIVTPPLPRLCHLTMMPQLNSRFYALCTVVSIFQFVFLLSPAGAQCLLCAATGTETSIETIPGPGERDDRPLRVDVTANLDFARLVAGSAGGSVAIDPGTGRAATSGDVATLGGLSFSGRVRVEGTPGRTIRIDMPRDIVLTSSTGGMAHVTGVTTGLPPVVRIGPDGRLEFGFGGRLQLTGTVDGDYRGRIMVTVSYE